MTLSNPKEALERVRALRTWLAEKHAFAGRGELPADVAALDALIADRDGLAGDYQELRRLYESMALTAGRQRGRAEAAEARLSALARAAQEVLDGLVARIEQAPTASIPVFAGVAELHTALASLAPAVPAQEEGKADLTYTQAEVDGILLASFPKVIHEPRVTPEHPNPGRTVSGEADFVDQDAADARSMSPEALEEAVADQEQREARRVRIAQIIDPDAWCNEDGHLIAYVGADEALAKADLILNDEGVRS